MIYRKIRIISLIGLIVILIVTSFFILKMKNIGLIQKPSIISNEIIPLNKDFLIVLNSTKIVEKIFAKRSGIMIPIRVSSPQYKLLIINITLINIGQEEKFFDPFKYPAELRINGKNYNGHYFTNDWFSLLGFIKPNEKIVGHIVFLIPKNATFIEFNIKYVWKNEERNICNIFLEIN